jgi:hypothetical protein
MVKLLVVLRTNHQSNSIYGHLVASICYDATLVALATFQSHLDLTLGYSQEHTATTMRAQFEVACAQRLGSFQRPSNKVLHGLIRYRHGGRRATNPPSSLCDDRADRVREVLYHASQSLLSGFVVNGF